MGDIENFVYDYCEARISRLSGLLFPLYFYWKLTTNMSNCSWKLGKFLWQVMIIMILDNNCPLLPSEAMHQRVLYCDISDITNHKTDK